MGFARDADLLRRSIVDCAQFFLDLDFASETEAELASIYRRSAGQWEARVQRLGWPHQARSFGTKGEAVRWARKIEAEMDAGIFMEVKEVRRMLLRDLIALYREKILPQRADVDRPRVLREIERRFGEYGVTVLDPRTISKWRDSLKSSGRYGRRGASSVNHYLNVLSALYTAGVKDFHLPIPLNPVKLVRRLPEPPARTQRVSDQVVDWLVEANRRSNDERRSLGGREPFGEFEPWLRLAIEVGMRRSEIASLEIQNINLDRRTAHLPNTKNGDARTVPLSSRAVEIIRKLIENHPIGAGRLFTLTAEGFKTAFRRARHHVATEHPEVAEIHFHDTRREATTRLAKKLPNVVELAAVTGHRKLDMLKRYYQPDPEELAKKLG